MQIHETDSSEIFGKSLSHSLKTLKDRGTSSVQRVTNKSTDMNFLNDSERQYIELNLERMEVTAKRDKVELEAIEKAEIRSAQCDRIREARQNLDTLMHIAERGFGDLVGKDIDACLTILREVSNIGSKDIIVAEQEFDVEQLFHLGEDDLQKALRTTNVIDFIRNASENGWNITINNEEIKLMKNGVEVAEIGMDFVGSELHRNQPVVRDDVTPTETL